jgi:hypothetical protein
MDIQTIEGRRRINDEIERLVMLCMDYASDYDTYKETERGMAVLDLYEGFYRSFSRLIRYTQNLPQLRTSEDEVKSGNEWLKQHGAINDDRKLMVRMQNGINIFDKYVKLLADQGVVFPASK